MEQSNGSWKIATVVAVLLMLGAIGWGAWNSRLNSDLKSERDQEKLKVESLLSEKLLVEKNLKSVDAQMKDALRKNEALERQVAEARNQGNLKDQSMKQLQRQIAANKKSYAELAARNKDMENQLASLSQRIAQLQDEQLASAKEAETLRNQVDNLKKELALAHNAYYDKVLVETTRGKKDKLVVRASRTKKMKATIVIPAGLKDVQFQLFDPNGKLISSSPEDGLLAVKITEDSNATASRSGATSGQAFKQAEMTFIPKKKLAKGTYKVEVLSESLPVGSFQMKLR